MSEEEYEELEKKLEELEEEVQYEEGKMKICAYGREELMHIEELYEEIKEIRNKLYESEE